MAKLSVYVPDKQLADAREATAVANTSKLVQLALRNLVTHQRQAPR